MHRAPKPASSQFRHSCTHCVHENSTVRESAEPWPGAAAVPLTALAFDELVSRALEDAQPRDSIGILMVSIDHFDVVTARQDPSFVQELLSIVSRRIADALRVGDKMTLHDDGLFILWAAGSGAPEKSEVAVRITEQFNEPVLMPAGQLPITVSVGMSVVVGSQCAETTSRMLRRQARSAVLGAQRNGRAQLAVFDRAIQRQAIESYETECLMVTALQDRRLGVQYQPIVNLHSGQTIAVEAAAHWNDDVLGSLSPATFIPIAEAGLMGEVEHLVLREAVAQVSAWNREGQPAPITSVNLSNRQLLDPGLIPRIESLLAENNLDPRQFCFEISESVLMSDVAASMTILGLMKDLGLLLAIDDFGTGYSSLSYLRRLPVDMLKIDQSFVQSIYNRDDRVIIKAIIDLAHTLGMTTVAEGVETRLQVEVLHALKCDMAQGPYLHAPAPADQIDFDQINFEAPSLSENPDFSSASARSTCRSVRL